MVQGGQKTAPVGLQRRRHVCGRDTVRGAELQHLLETGGADVVIDRRPRTGVMNGMPATDAATASNSMPGSWHEQFSLFPGSVRAGCLTVAKRVKLDPR